MIAGEKYMRIILINVTHSRMQLLIILAYSLQRETRVICASVVDPEFSLNGPLEFCPGFGYVSYLQPGSGSSELDPGSNSDKFQSTSRILIPIWNIVNLRTGSGSL